MASVWRKPREGAAIADPRSEAPMQVHRCPILCLVRIGDCDIYRNDSGGRKVVPKGDLDRHALLSHDHSAKVCRRSSTVYAKRVGRIESPQSGEVREVRMQTI